MHTKILGRMGLLAIMLSSVGLIASMGGIQRQAFADEEAIEFITNAEYIKGHLEQAVANKDAGVTHLAVAHAGHPIEEVYSQMNTPLESVRPQLAADLEDELGALQTSVQNDTLQAFEERVDSIFSMLDEAVQAYAGAEAEEPETKAAVVKELVETAGREYSEAVQGGQIVEMIEYQDASAFIARANATFATFRSDMPAHEAEEIAELFEELDDSLSANAEPENVQTLLGGIVHELEEVYSLGGEDEPYDGWAYIDRINELLDQSVEAYKAGTYEQARDLAREAYIDNYELIEGDIAADNRGLMLEIEEDLRMKLVEMIDNRLPAEQIEEQADSIKAKLETARAVVTPEFPLAVLAIAASIAGVIVLARTGGIKSLNRAP